MLFVHDCVMILSRHMLFICEAPLNPTMMALRELHFYPWTLVFSIKG